MEVDKRSRSKTKEKERSKDPTSRKSIERPKERVESEKPKKEEKKDKAKLDEKEARSKSKRTKVDGVEDKKPKETSKKAENGVVVKDSGSKKGDDRKLPAPTIAKPAKGSNSSTKDAISHRQPSASKSKRPSVPASEQEGEFDYEDDFEDYDDDFEADDDDDEPTNVPSPKVEKESDQSDVSTSRAATAASMTSVETRPRTIQSRINFQQAHVTEAQLANFSKIRGRAKELLQLIELDAVSYDLFDMAPVRDYEFFMQNFGKSNMIQVQVQTGDDSIEREIQTDELDLENKWSQHPATDVYGCGGDNAISDSDARAKLRFDSELLNSLLFRRFVERAGTLITDLLADDYVSQEPTFQNKSSMSFSSSFSTVGLGPLAKKCSVGAIAFADSQPTIFATAYHIYESLLDDVTGRTLIAVWNITDLVAPFKLLVCDGQCRTCAFAPERPSAVFAGLNDSSVVAWDLQESDSLRSRTIPWTNSEVAAHEPTYSSAFLCKETRHETSPVVAVAALNSLRKASSAQTVIATVESYQLISLHGDGSIRIWTALMTTSKEPSELDLGLRPGGRLKLVQSATLKAPMTALRNICGDPMLKAVDIDAYCLGWTNDRQSDFYVGTGTGYILHLTRHEGKAGPSAYQPDLEALSDVLCISLNPFESSVLLTGCSDGYIRLYKASFARPLASLSLPSTFKDPTVSCRTPIRQIQWSPTSPYKFYSLHGNMIMATWDLKQDRQTPQTIEATNPLVSFQISSSVALGSGPANFIALPNQNGTVDVHQLKADGGKTKYSPSDGAKLLKLIEML